jgi:hypothetical protein
LTTNGSDITLAVPPTTAIYGAGEAGAGRNAGQSILQRIFLRASPGGAGLANRNAPPKAAPASVAPSDHQ